MDKRFVIDRVRTDLRSDVYELMTHPGYHALEKDLTESLVNANKLYCALRNYTCDTKISLDEKNDRRQLFAYIIYQQMNASLGGFHFDRHKSFSTGEAQDKLLGELIETLDFEDFLNHYHAQLWLKNEPEFDEFVKSRQFRNLEDSITSVIKKNKVIPALSRAIAQDVVDTLHLDQRYLYVRISPVEQKRLFDFPVQEIYSRESLKKITIAVDDELCSVMIKRVNRTSDQFRYLMTDFGALIKGL